MRDTFTANLPQGSQRFIMNIRLNRRLKKNYWFA